jgi:tetratricopeptide (TPR) repeat protein
MSLVGFALLISGAFLALTITGQVLIVRYHRRRKLKYNLLKGIEHFSQLAAGFSLLLAVFALLYGAYSQEASTKEAEEMNRQSVSIAKSQTALMQDTALELTRVSKDLAVNADASVRAANSLEKQLNNAVEQENRKPAIHIAIAAVNPNGGEGSLVGTIDSAELRASHTVIAGSKDRSFVIRAQIANFGDAMLHAGTVNFRVASLDGLANPTIGLDSVAGMKLGMADEPDTDDPFGGQDALGLPFSNLPTKTMKDFQLLLSLPRPNDINERRFRLYIDFVGDAAPRMGVISFDVHFGSNDESEVEKAETEEGAGDYQHAFQAFMLSAEAGNARAMRGLGRMYEGDLGINQDCDAMMRWYKAAVAQGDQGAMSNLGWVYERGFCLKNPDYQSAKDWYERATAAGGADGMANLGTFYMFRHGSLEPDYEKAQEWLSRAIFLGNARAMNNLGFMYENGLGFQKNLSTALMWYMRSAKGGNKDAAAAVQRLQPDIH